MLFQHGDLLLSIVVHFHAQLLGSIQSICVPPVHLYLFLKVMEFLFEFLIVKTCQL